MPGEGVVNEDNGDRDGGCDDDSVDGKYDCAVCDKSGVPDGDSSELSLPNIAFLSFCISFICS